ncbi:MAG: type I phosphomannose isomerase catalytic subunit [Marinifilaceae bacterium]
MLYPLKFTPIIKQTIWGGKRLADKSSDPNVKENIGESWELSGVQDNVSVVSNGALAENTLEELIEIYMGELVGDHIYERFGVEFPLLVKYIDACDNLSIQVHPDDEKAHERHNAYGKTEMWYVVDADKDAELIMGFNKESNEEEYLEKLNTNKLPDILNVEHVSKDDAFFIPAGMVHAIGKGCYIAEIQQTSDITYRIYDYDRRDKEGNPRELHTELATDVIDFNYYPKHKIRVPQELNDTERLVKCDYFTTNLIVFDKEVEKDYFTIDSFVIYMCLEGEFTLVYNEKESIKVQQGETVLVPACFKNIFLIPSQTAKVMEVFIEE